MCPKPLISLQYVSFNEAVIFKMGEESFFVFHAKNFLSEITEPKNTPLVVKTHVHYRVFLF